jgi:hypothetical protein
MTSHVPSAATLETATALTPELLRAWAWHRQGLDGTLQGRTPQEVLATAGWARSVGGANPYLTLFARAGIRRQRWTRTSASSESTNCPQPAAAPTCWAGRTSTGR